MIQPAEILRCDVMVKNHPSLVLEPTASLRLWSITIGPRTFIRYREGVTYGEKHTSQVIWGRIIDERKSKDSTPAPRTFADTLSRALGIL